MSFFFISAKWRVFPLQAAKRAGRRSEVETVGITMLDGRMLSLSCKYHDAAKGFRLPPPIKANATVAPGTCTVRGMMSTILTVRMITCMASRVSLIGELEPS